MKICFSKRFDVFALLAVLLSLVCDVTSWRMTISADHQHVRPGNQRVTIMCQAEVPITDCQFKAKYETKEGPIIVLEPPVFDVRSYPSAPAQSGTHVYTGTGLQNGQCGMTVPGVPAGRNIFGCRTKAATGGWRYQTTTVYADLFEPIPLHFQPKLLVTQPGDNVTLRCFVDDHATDCNIALAANYRWEGYGSCGLYANAVEEMNGPVWCQGWRGDTHKESTVMIIVVAKPPSSPNLVINTPVLAAGATLTASCTATGARPVANITWYLDDEVIRDDGEDDEPYPEWKWPWSQHGITQKLERVVTEEDNGKVVKCVVGHEAMKIVKQAKKRITVESACGQRGNQKPVQPSLNTRIMFPGDSNNDDNNDNNANNNNNGKPNEYPWMVGIYKRKRDGSYNQECGGSLVTTRIVLTAAQCFWDERYNVVNVPTLFKIALGKYHREWSTVDAGEQRVDVAQIVLNKRYRGRAGKFQYDIAVVKLAKEAVLAPGVGLVCVDWDKNTFMDQLKEGTTGLVSGWGIDNTGNSSPTLRTLSLPVVTEDACFEALNDELSMYYTADKFCAGYLNQNTSVCPGDSGGGLVFQKENTTAYYLRGIVSVAFKPFSNVDPCYGSLYTGFTSLTDYLAWIKELL